MYTKKGMLKLKNNTNITKAREFCEKVRTLANEYNLPFFIVTDGAGSTNNNGYEAVRVARDNHIKLEKENCLNPYED